MPLKPVCTLQRFMRYICCNITLQVHFVIYNIGEISASEKEKIKIQEQAIFTSLTINFLDLQIYSELNEL